MHQAEERHWRDQDAKGDHGADAAVRLLAVAQAGDQPGRDFHLLAVLELEGDGVRGDGKMVVPVLGINLGLQRPAVVADLVPAIAF